MRVPGGRAAATFIVLAAATMTGCSGGSEMDEETRVEVREDTSDVAPIEEALALLPETVGRVDFSSDRRSAERLQLIADSATSFAALGEDFESRLDDVAATDLAAVSRLEDATDLMTEGDAAFSQLDVRWSMTARAGERRSDEMRSVEVFRLVDAVEMNDVVADLEDAGFEAAEDDGWVALHLPGQLSEHVDVLDGNSIGGRYPDLFFPDVAVNVEEHLVALGDYDVVTPDAPVTTLDALASLLPEDRDALERFAVTAAVWFNCYEPVEKATNFQTSPATIAAWAEKYDASALGLPAVTSLAWTPGEELVHTSFFADEKQASSAYTTRDKVYRGVATRDEDALGVLMPGRGNESPYEPGWTMRQQGSVIEVLHNRTNPSAAFETYSRNGLGFDTCGTPGMFS